jgi:O-antigen/teichoic acid export membrane protein
MRGAVNRGAAADAAMPAGSSVAPATAHEGHSMLGSQLRRDTLASIVGRAWSAGLVFATVPLYIKVLGVEAYGLIGLYTALQALFVLLDLGLSTAANRGLARLAADEGTARRQRDVIRSLESVYWAIAVLIALAALVLVPLLGDRWQQGASLPPDAVRMALLTMGLALALQFPFTLYSSALLGLQQQILLNALLIATTTVRSVGALLVLWWVSPTIEAFFLWQILSGVLQTCVAALAVWRQLPRHPGAPRVSKAELLEMWPFAAGVSGITVLGLVLAQGDKIILSQLLSLEAFGYYSLAATAAAGLYTLASPIFVVLLPRFSRLVAQSDDSALVQLYHVGTQLLAVTLVPLAIVGALFAPEALLVWTGNPQIADNTHLILSLLLVGTAVHSVLVVPYALQLAVGWTRLTFYQNLIAVLLLVPLLWWAAHRYQGVGAAGVWIVLHTGCFLISVQFMHRRLLPHEKWRWYRSDLGLPLVATLAVALAARFVFPGWSSPWLVLGYLVATLALAMLAASLVVPYTRGWLGVLAHRAGLVRGNAGG